MLVIYVSCLSCFLACSLQPFLPVDCSFVVTCWERADFLARLYIMLSGVCGVLAQVWYLITRIAGSRFKQVLDLFLYPFQMYCTVYMMYLLYLDVLIYI